MWRIFLGLTLASVFVMAQEPTTNGASTLDPNRQKALQNALGGLAKSLSKQPNFTVADGRLVQTCAIPLKAVKGNPAADPKIRHPLSAQQLSMDKQAEIKAMPVCGK